MSATLTTVGTPTYAAAKFDNGVDTTGGYFSYPDASQYRASDFCVEAWVRFTGATTGYQILFGRANNEWAGFNGGKPAWVSHTAPNAIPVDGAFHHVVWTLNTGAIRMLVDGVLVYTGAGQNAGTTSWPASGTGSTMHVGRWASNAAGDNPAYPFNGLVDELRVSKVIRYPGSTYTVPTAAHTVDSDTLALYRFEGNGTDATAAGVPPADTTAPSTPTGLTATPGNAQVALSWTASTDNVAVTGYRVYRAGTLVGSPTATSYTDTGLTNGTAYSYTVAAVDAAGNLSPQTAAVSATPTATVTPDTTAPIGVTLTATPGNTQVALTGAGTDAVGITRWVFKRGTTTIADQAGPSYTDTGLTNGTAYTYTVTAYDAAGNNTTSASTTATPTNASTTVAPNDTGIIYSPYTWDVTAARAMCVCGGNYLRARLVTAAATINATFDVSTFAGNGVIWWRVDDGPWASANLAATIAMTVPASNWGSQHLVEIRIGRLTGADRYTTPTTAVRFTGFTVAAGSTIATALLRRRPRHLLTYGDSLLDGYGVLANGITDSRHGWAGTLGELVGAEIGIVGANAQGLTKGGESNLPALPTSYNKLWSGAARSFTTPTQPDVVLINEGTNDNGADISSAAVAILNGILAATTTTKILVVQQWNGTLYRTVWQNAIAACSAPTRVSYLDTSGWLSTVDTSDNLHPYGYINDADLTPRIAAAVSALLTGGTTFTPRRFINKAGTALPIG